MTDEMWVLRDAVRSGEGVTLISGERFRVISGFERYMISDLGCVFSGIRACRFIKPWLCDGYPFASLMERGAPRATKISIHRLVAEAFLPNPLQLPTVNHKDGIKTNSVLLNLEWATYGENNDHARDMGLALSFGETHYAAKLTESNVVEIRRLASAGSMLHREIGDMFGVKRQAIDKIVSRKAWRRVA